MTAIPTAGGAGYSSMGMVALPQSWMAMPINGLPTGQYNVTATVSFKKTVGGAVTVIYSPVAIVNVP